MNKMAIITLYLHENLEATNLDNISEKYLVLEEPKNNTHLKFLKEVSFEENWAIGLNQKKVLDFQNE